MVVGLRLARVSFRDVATKGGAHGESNGAEFALVREVLDILFRVVQRNCFLLFGSLVVLLYGARVNLLTLVCDFGVLFDLVFLEVVTFNLLFDDLIQR